MPGGGSSTVWGLLLLLLVVALIIETQCKNETEAIMHVTYNKLITKRILAKREINCNSDEYSLGGHCCKKCERGFVKNISCPTDTSKHCAPCENGKEYIDHVNDLDKCLRCALCDSGFGLKVAENCTQAQNTKCTCAENHFCNSSVPCTHCNLCTTCESGVIEKQCTSTSDTVCGMKETGMLWLAITLGILLPLVALGGIVYYVRQKRSKTRTSVHEHAQPSISDEVAPLRQDVDLSSYVTDITEEMTYDEVLKFVRYHKVPQTKIDEIIHDNFGASEKKIHLFQAWLQRHGINEAYETLIRSLRNLGMRAAADKIERKLQAAVSSSE